MFAVVSFLWGRADKVSIPTAGFRVPLKLTAISIFGTCNV